MSRARTVLVISASGLFMACAAGSKAPATPSQVGEASGAAPQAAPAGYPQQPGAYPPAPPPAEPAAPVQPQAAPGQFGGQPSGGTSRSMAFSAALDEVDSSVRQLDVAAGDCSNACRALGSMDRAAGRLCSLAQGNDEGRRCEDAKKKVYTARDRVKQTCGTCPGGVSVERSAPIPSGR
ncbi:MAG: hypothetical protein JST00_19840 [Deltaproteobacteria bacterium]|nr:hypothetical protein [Deltaproteobacteria bacterium]